ncbi:hypothetical protein COCON_G00083300 [Conger conger]|uniref:Ubiquinol-cytochrome-c reductase complex assembly factor 3 n=1 Tax=Conger conger TaxID=82655 RepID=A0A9Q1I2S7_CONCO|nr:hypothetical protein COCON_G00083300 [Conger conger]
MSTMKNILTITGLVCTGFILWAVAAPNEERKREILKNLPEANPVKMQETRRRNALMMQVIKEAAETDDNIARGPGAPK